MQNLYRDKITRRTATVIVLVLALAFVVAGGLLLARMSPALDQSQRERVAIGSDLVIGAGEQVLGDVSVTDGNLTVLGEVMGNVIVVGGNADIEGAVAGDVIVTNGYVRLAAGSRVGGDVLTLTGHVAREDGAYVGGTMSTLDLPLPVMDGALMSPDGVLMSPVGRGGPNSGWSANSVGRFMGLIGWSMLGLIVLAAGTLTSMLVPGRVRVSSDTLEAEPGPSVVTGVIMGLLCWPAIGLISVALAVTVVGVVLIPVVILAALLLFLFGLVVVSRWLGKRVLESARLSNGHGSGSGSGYAGSGVRYPASAVLEVAVGMAVVLSCTLIPLAFLPPWAGVLLVALVFFASCVGVGATLLSRFGTLPPRRSVSAPSSRGHLPTPP